MTYKTHVDRQNMPRFIRRAPLMQKCLTILEVSGSSSLCTWHMTSASNRSSLIVARRAVSVLSTLLNVRSASAVDTGRIVSTCKDKANDWNKVRSLTCMYWSTCCVYMLEILKSVTGTRSIYILKCLEHQHKSLMFIGSGEHSTRDSKLIHPWIGTSCIISLCHVHVLVVGWMLAWLDANGFKDR